MKLLLLLCLTVLLAAACKKDKVPFTYVFAHNDSMYVEKSQRLDTIDFNFPHEFTPGQGPMFYFRSKPYMDLTQNPDYPVNHSSIYDYRINGDTLLLRSMLSSYSGFYKYDFRWGSDHRSFTVKRFYNRKSLPDVIEFIKLK
jgi:hypothetical protein